MSKIRIVIDVPGDHAYSWVDKVNATFDVNVSDALMGTIAAAALSYFAKALSLATDLTEYAEQEKATDLPAADAPWPPSNDLPVELVPHG